MAILHSVGSEKNGIIVWILEKNEFEFTKDEFVTLTDNIRHNTVFEILEKERPSLKAQLLAIFRQDFSEDMESEDFEFQVEQALLTLRSNFRM
jgi:hypothetical protein